ncbi:MAG: ATP-binding cassette domain-containing protein [Candidatus Latescibacteria bacterium]|nr:ATP-binding cassette domain-containing protein [Candidatus Latescibacterota bacterium]
MIQMQNLTKFYGDFKAVDNISFDVRDGEILGFLGPNGAGKTTTLKMLTCYMPPTKGSISFNDLDVLEDSMEIRRMIGYLPESAPLYEYMSVREYLDYICDLREIKGQRRNDRMDAMIYTCGLSRMIGKNIGELSKGYRQRVGIAQAMIHEPEILILDEPTVGLDPNQIVEIRNLIKEVGREKTVMLSTHILSEVEATCDRVVIIAAGEIVADGTPDTLRKDMAGKSVLNLELKGDVPDAARVYSSIPGVENVETLTKSDGGSTLLAINVLKGYDVREETFRASIDNGWTIFEMHLDKTNLEDVFRQLTKIQGG